MSEPQGYTQAVVDILNSKLGQSITQAFTAGEEQERERIIKLLEGYLVPEGTASPCWRTEHDVAVEVIALIKGAK